MRPGGRRAHPLDDLESGPQIEHDHVTRPQPLGTPDPEYPVAGPESRDHRFLGDLMPDEPQAEGCEHGRTDRSEGG
jgi:hypothetical protein